MLVRHNYSFLFKILLLFMLLIIKLNYENTTNISVRQPNDSVRLAKKFSDSGVNLNNTN